MERDGAKGSEGRRNEGWRKGGRERRKNVDREWSGTGPKEVREEGMRDRGREGGKDGRMWTEEGGKGKEKGRREEGGMEGETERARDEGLQRGKRHLEEI